MNSFKEAMLYKKQGSSLCEAITGLLLMFLYYARKKWTTPMLQKALISWIINSYVMLGWPFFCFTMYDALLQSVSAGLQKFLYR